jgi:Cu(I)/Ag(I) efflux system membrane fusion protein
MTRVEKLFVNFNGMEVEASQPLAELYSPELYQAVQELLSAERSARERSHLPPTAARSLLGDPHELVRLAREKLLRWGVTPSQIDAIVARGKAEQGLPILAPIGGTVVKKNVVEGQYLAEGESLFEVVDLDHVWVQAPIYEAQLGFVRDGPGRGDDGRGVPG